MLFFHKIPLFFSTYKPVVYNRRVWSLLLVFHNLGTLCCIAKLQLHHISQEIMCKSCQVKTIKVSMASLSMFISLDNQTSVMTSFKPLPFISSAPFPLNTEPTVRLFVVLYLLVILISGCSLRHKILRFTSTLSVKDNPLNIFVWQDQLNGLFLMANIMYTLTTILLSYPLSSFVGDELCNFADMIGILYITGQTVWSCLIAIYRLMLIKYQNSFNYGIKDMKFLTSLLLFGHCLIIASSAVGAYVDKGLLYKLCTHYSVEDLNIKEVS